MPIAVAIFKGEKERKLMWWKIHIKNPTTGKFMYLAKNNISEIYNKKRFP